MKLQSIGNRPGDPGVESILVATGEERRLDPRLGWSICFVLSLVLYVGTANRGVQWADSTHFMDRIVHGDLVGTLGLALSHPLHQWLGRLAVWIGGPAPITITAVSSLFGALTIANVFGCVSALTGRRGPAFFAAASLGLANTFWRVSTLTEVYSISTALQAGTCWCLVLYVRDSRPSLLWLACLLNGLGGANDLQSGLTMLVLVVFTAFEWWKSRITFAQAGLAALAYLVGVMPYGALVIRELVQTGDLVATLRSALFGTMWADEVLSRGFSRRVIVVDLVFPIMNFPNLLLPAAAYGLFRASSLEIPERSRYALGAILLIQAAFGLRYDVVEQYNFLIPMYVMLAIFGGVGAHAYLSRHPHRIGIPALAIGLLVATPFCYVTAMSVARSYDVLAGFARNKPYRDDYVYLMIPWTVVERSAEQMSDHALALAGRDGLVVSEDYMARYCIAYRAMLLDREKPEIIAASHANRDELIRRAHAEHRPVVLIPFNRDRLRDRPPVGEWRREGDLYLLAAERRETTISPR